MVEEFSEVMEQPAPAPAEPVETPTEPLQPGEAPPTPPAGTSPPMSETKKALLDACIDGSLTVESLRGRIQAIAAKID